MSKQVHDIIARGEARVVDVPAAVAPRHQIEVDRNFELPGGIYAATVACYLGFLVITGAAFMAPALAIPLVVMAISIIFGFGVVSVWNRMKNDGLKSNDTHPMTAGRFAAKGIMTNTGPCTARDATVQVLILPVLIVFWGLTAVLIAALV